ncbi:transcription termination factor NusA [Ferrovibrio sp.]|uniref:transcription termination factor NusA n=1 Tax=Ferrovibrio sp. TaxID=1917215 RepID=UPI0025BD9DC9|nr:transcription termination factor NusA [Ferrovibrio sp.]MBX3456072.1 transcription termination factor NusA [Ferrovibrio sp.]
MEPVTSYNRIELLQVADAVAREKVIDRDVVLMAMEDAIQKAARSRYGMENDIHAEIDRKSGEIRLARYLQVVDKVENDAVEIGLIEAQRRNPDAQIGDTISESLPPIDFGRIAAQTAKQVIVQKVREAERERQYEEYKDRIGEIVNGLVKRVEYGNVTIDLGRAEAIIRRDELLPRETFRQGDRVRAYIYDVRREPRGPQIFLSRSHPQFMAKLFAQEVPEIYDGTVLIKGCAREAGERTKIAVISRDRDVDSVGACVGMKGMRVQSIIRELRGEKIDIIEFSEDPVVFATHALSPAKITRVTVLSGLDKHMEVIVDDSQLSLAIGKKGQNVRLASKLLGWRIDIKSEEEKRQEVESAMAALTIPGAPVSVLMDHGLSEPVLEKLLSAGIPTVEKLTAVTQEDLDNAGITMEMVEGIQAAVNSYYGQFETQTAEPAAYEEEPVSAEVAEAEVGQEAETAEQTEVVEQLKVAEQTEIADEAAGADPGEVVEAVATAATTNETKESGTIESAD